MRMRTARHDNSRKLSESVALDSEAKCQLSRAGCMCTCMCMCMCMLLCMLLLLLLYVFIDCNGSLGGEFGARSSCRRGVGV